jgi:hypothetical protein
LREFHVLASAYIVHFQKSTAYAYKMSPGKCDKKYLFSSLVCLFSQTPLCSGVFSRDDSPPVFGRGTMFRYAKDTYHEREYDVKAWIDLPQTPPQIRLATVVVTQFRIQARASVSSR